MLTAYKLLLVLAVTVATAVGVVRAIVVPCGSSTVVLTANNSSNTFSWQSCSNVSVTALGLTDASLSIVNSSVSQLVVDSCARVSLAVQGSSLAAPISFQGTGSALDVLLASSNGTNTDAALVNVSGGLFDNMSFSITSSGMALSAPSLPDNRPLRLVLITSAAFSQGTIVVSNSSVNASASSIALVQLRGVNATSTTFTVVNAVVTINCSSILSNATCAVLDLQSCLVGGNSEVKLLTSFLSARQVLLALYFTGFFSFNASTVSGRVSFTAQGCSMFVSNYVLLFNTTTLTNGLNMTFASTVGNSTVRRSGVIVGGQNVNASGPVDMLVADCNLDLYGLLELNRGNMSNVSLKVVRGYQRVVGTLVLALKHTQLGDISFTASNATIETSRNTSALVDVESCASVGALTMATSLSTVKASGNGFFFYNLTVRRNVTFAFDQSSFKSNSSTGLFFLVSTSKVINNQSVTQTVTNSNVTASYIFYIFATSVSNATSICVNCIANASGGTWSMWEEAVVQSATVVASSSRIDAVCVMKSYNSTMQATSIQYDNLNSSNTFIAVFNIFTGASLDMSMSGTTGRAMTVGLYCISWNMTGAVALRASNTSLSSQYGIFRCDDCTLPSLSLIASNTTVVAQNSFVLLLRGTARGVWNLTTAACKLSVSTSGYPIFFLSGLRSQNTTLSSFTVNMFNTTCSAPYALLYITNSSFLCAQLWQFLTSNATNYSKGIYLISSSTSNISSPSVAVMIYGTAMHVTSALYLTSTTVQKPSRLEVSFGQMSQIFCSSDVIDLSSTCKLSLAAVSITDSNVSTSAALLLSPLPVVGMVGLIARSTIRAANALMCQDAFNSSSLVISQVNGTFSDDVVSAQGSGMSGFVLNLTGSNVTGNSYVIYSMNPCEGLRATVANSLLAVSSIWTTSDVTTNATITVASSTVVTTDSLVNFLLDVADASVVFLDCQISASSSLVSATLTAVRTTVNLTMGNATCGTSGLTVSGDANSTSFTSSSAVLSTASTSVSFQSSARNCTVLFDSTTLDTADSVVSVMTDAIDAVFTVRAGSAVVTNDVVFISGATNTSVLLDCANVTGAQNAVYASGTVEAVNLMLIGGAASFASALFNGQDCHHLNVTISGGSRVELGDNVVIATGSVSSVVVVVNGSSLISIAALVGVASATIVGCSFSASGSNLRTSASSHFSLSSSNMTDFTVSLSNSTVELGNATTLATFDKVDCSGCELTMDGVNVSGGRGYLIELTGMTRDTSAVSSLIVSARRVTWDSVSGSVFHVSASEKAKDTAVLHELVVSNCNFTVSRLLLVDGDSNDVSLTVANSTISARNDVIFFDATSASEPQLFLTGNVTLFSTNLSSMLPSKAVVLLGAVDTSALNASEYSTLRVELTNMAISYFQRIFKLSDSEQSQPYAVDAELSCVVWQQRVRNRTSVVRLRKVDVMANPRTVNATVAPNSPCREGPLHDTYSATSTFTKDGLSMTETSTWTYTHRLTPPPTLSHSFAASGTATATLTLIVTQEKTRTTSFTSFGTNSQSATVSRLATLSDVLSISGTRSRSHWASQSRDPSATKSLYSDPVLLSPLEQLQQKVAVATAAASFASASPDMAMLAAASLMACSPASSKSAAGPTSYLLSPFYDFGDAAIVAGNAGIVIAVCLLQNGLARAVKRKGTLEAAKAKVYYPALAWVVFTFLLPGLAFAATRSAFDSQLLVTAAATAGVGIFFVLQVKVRLKAVASARFEPHQTLPNVPFAQQLYPDGFWSPKELVKAFGPFFNKMKEQTTQFNDVPAVFSVAFCIVTRFPFPQDLCYVQYIVLAATAGLNALFLLYIRPFRLKLQSWLLGFSMIFLVCVMICNVQFARSQVADVLSWSATFSMAQMFSVMANVIYKVWISILAAQERAKKSKKKGRIGVGFLWDDDDDVRDALDPELERDMLLLEEKLWRRDHPATGRQVNDTEATEVPLKEIRGIVAVDATQKEVTSILVSCGVSKETERERERLLRQLAMMEPLLYES